MLFICKISRQLNPPETENIAHVNNETKHFVTETKSLFSSHSSWCHRNFFRCQLACNEVLIRKKKFPDKNFTRKWSTIGWQRPEHTEKVIIWNISIKPRAPAIKTPSRRITIIAGDSLNLWLLSDQLLRRDCEHSFVARSALTFSQVSLNNESYSLSFRLLLKHWVALRSINYIVIYTASRELANQLMYVVRSCFRISFILSLSQ